MLLMQHQYLFLSVVQNTLTIDRGLTKLFIRGRTAKSCFHDSCFYIFWKEVFLTVIYHLVRKNAYTLPLVSEGKSRRS